MSSVNILLEIIRDEVLICLLHNLVSPNDVHRMCVVSKCVNSLIAQKRWPILDSEGVVVGHVTYV